MKRPDAGRLAVQVLRWGLLLVLTVLALGPIFVLIMNSLKPENQFIDNQMGLPHSLTLHNITSAWSEGGYIHAYANSAIIGGATVIVVCSFAGLAGYALARLQFKGTMVVLLGLLVSMTVPVGMFLVPLFYAFQHLDLMDTKLGLVIIYSGIFLPFNILLLRAFFLRIPSEFAESARLDGASEFNIFLRIYAPLARPAFATAAILVAMWSWNEFYFANAFIQSIGNQTASLKYLTFASSGYTANWSAIMAGGLITAAPMLVLYILLQRRFVQGLAEGGLKG